MAPCTLASGMEPQHSKGTVWGCRGDHRPWTPTQPVRVKVSPNTAPPTGPASTRRQLPAHSEDPLLFPAAASQRNLDPLQCSSTTTLSLATASSTCLLTIPEFLSLCFLHWKGHTCPPSPQGQSLSPTTPAQSLLSLSYLQGNTKTQAKAALTSTNFQQPLASDFSLPLHSQASEELPKCSCLPSAPTLAPIPVSP